MRALYKLFVVINLITLAVLPAIQSASAQSRPPTVIVTDVDVSHTPTLGAYVSVVDPSGAFRDNLTLADFGVTEDGAAVSGLSVSKETIGLAVVIVLDSGAYVYNRGVTGTRWDDVRNYSPDKREKNGLVSELVDYRMTDDNDWSGMVGVAREITSVVPLTTDQGEVRNKAYLMNPYTNKTPLWEGIGQALKLFEAPDPALVPILPRLSKSVVVFSDGIDIATRSYELTDLINRAQKQGVVYYTIGIGSLDGGGFDSRGLERLAEQTGGVYIYQNSKEGRDQALALFDRIVTQRSQYVLKYQTRAGEGTHRVCVRVNAAPGTLACKDFASSLRMPKLTISAVPTSTIRGAGQKVTITPEWTPTDGYRRDPKKIVYLVDGVVAAEVTAAPWTFEWDVSKVEKEGEHSIEARLYDSILPDTSYSASNPVKVEVKFPAIEKPKNWLVQNLLALLLVPVVIVLLILIVLMRKQIAKGVRATTSRVRAATQSLTKSKYKLVIVRGPNMGQEFWLNKQRMRIGRDESADIPLLSDPHVSGFHAELTEDMLGYSIADLTSANGTFVNGQRLGVGQQKGQAGPPMLLQPGCIIRVGGTEMRLDRMGGTTRDLRSYGQS